ncbi:MAG: tetratricopeptide repeat protein [Bacteroidetes bacterium]|nr:tetratricopeptide repeat protein [Bacteroidota bacterium]
MFNQEFEDHLDNNVISMVEQYEEMRKNNESCFFEQDTFEQIIEFYEEENKLKKALEVVDVAISQYPFSAGFLVKKAQALFDSRKFNESYDILEQAEVLDPGEMTIYVLRSDIYLERLEYSKAVDSLLDAMTVADKEDIENIYLELADVYEEWERPKEMYKSLKLTLKENPGNEEALNRMWYCVKRHKDFEDSIKFHEKLIDKKPYSHLAWHNLGQAYAALGLYEQAVEAYEYALVIKDDFEPAIKDCANVYYLLKDFKKALEHYHTLSGIADSSVRTLYKLAKCYESLRKYSDALLYYRKALKIDPEYAKAYYRIGFIYDNLEMLEGAISSLEKAVSLDPRKPQYHALFGRVTKRMGFFEKALTCYLRALELDSSNPDYWQQMTILLVENNEFDDAITSLDQGMSECLNTIDLLYLKAAVLFEFGQKKEGTIVFESALEQDYSRHDQIFKNFPELKNNNYILELIDQYNDPE